jgi:hypothetical protein
MQNGGEKSMKCVGMLYRIAVMFFVFSSIAAAQDPTELAAKPVSEAVVLSDFKNRVRAYTEMRETIESEMPALSKQATAEAISAHKAALLKKVLAARKGAVRGEIFTPAAEKALRTVITTHYSGRDSMELRKEVAEAENKTVPVKVNAVYPEAAELLEMPAKLLLTLPELPKQVRYRFVGNNLLIVDRENHLIVDYMTNALP